VREIIYRWFSASVWVPFGIEEMTSYHAGINKCIFEVGVSIKELLAEERGILEGCVDGDVEGQVGREVREVDFFEHSF
jgi:hypothetical protein